MHASFAPSPHYKSSIDLAPPRYLFDNSHDEHGVVPESHTLEAAHIWSAPYPASYNPPSSRGSLLDELYDQDMSEHNVTHDPYADHHRRSALPPPGHWAHMPQTAHGDSPLLHGMRHMHDIAMTRRNTFPYVRQDRAEPMYTPPPYMNDHDSLCGSPYGSRPSTVYSEPLSLDGSPQMAMIEPLEPFAHSVHSPHAHYQDYRHLDGIKTEDAPVIVPSQTGYCRPGSTGMPPLPCLPPHNGLLVQHTDDAASKETQYLRRRCFNCHTTEPPSWRRSTLNPGKIVCNKCGLYERTHLRPRPLRFDELRAGSKSRKQPKTTANGSPKAGKMAPMVKKEPRESEMEAAAGGMMPRRSSVSSTSSSVSGGATSDWDDNVSVYSSGSAPSSSMGSPASQTYPIPRDINSQSPPLMGSEGGIRLPNAPLTDIASLTPSPHMAPRKSATMPYYSGQPQTQDEMFRHGSLPMAEVTGWQSIPLQAGDLGSAKNAKPHKAVMA